MQLASKEYNERVWAGDPKTVSEAFARYWSDPEQELIPYAVALYSFRSKDRYADKLVELRMDLIAYARDFMKVQSIGAFSKARANKADVLSTHLEWISRREDLPCEEQCKLLKWATDLCEYGIGLTNHYCKDGSRDHTWCLLMLTSARLEMSGRRMPEARTLLNQVQEAVPSIRDARQRARIYAKLGFLYRKAVCHGPGFYWGFRAVFSQGATLAQRLKFAAALLNIDR